MFSFVSQHSLQVSTNGYISFGAVLNFSNPTEFPSPSLSYIVAPFWTEFDSDTVAGVQCDEYSESESESINGSEYIFQEVANFIKKLKPDVMLFNPAWMIICGWNNTNKIISPQVYLLHNSVFPLVRSNECLSAE